MNKSAIRSVIALLDKADKQIEGITPKEANALLICNCEDAVNALREALTKQPASKPWVGLTEFDIDQIPYSCSHADARLIAYASDAKLKEKNT